MYKKNFEITFLKLTMAEIKQFSIIQAFTAPWEIKDKEMASDLDLILNFIKMNKIGIKLIQDSKTRTGKLNFRANLVWFWNGCHFLNFYLSESCKSLHNRELFYLCHGYPYDNNFKDFLYIYASWIFYLKFHPFVTRTDIKSGILPQGRYWFS